MKLPPYVIAALLKALNREYDKIAEEVEEIAYEVRQMRRDRPIPLTHGERE